MGSKRCAYAPRTMLRLLVFLAGLNLCCLCLAPVARADWGTVYCRTTADSLDVATAKSTIAAFKNYHSYVLDGGCCQTNPFASQCTTMWIPDSGVRFYMCGSCRCDKCLWVGDMWSTVADSCAKNYGGVDRAAGFVSYDWSPGIWNKYGF